MAISINGTKVIHDTYRELITEGVAPGSVDAEQLFDMTGQTVGDTYYVTDTNTLATWTGSVWLTPAGRIVYEQTDISGGSYLTSPGNGYTYCTFTNSGTLTVAGAGTVDILVVGGGGGTGPYSDSRNGGAGGGGVAYWENVQIAAGNYVVEVGAGGVASNGPTGNGNPSVFGVGSPYQVVALGGGGGGGGPRSAQVAAGTGGSGGGGSGFASYTASAAASQPGQNPGKSGLVNYGQAGGVRTGSVSLGGGGAGMQGGPSPGNNYPGGSYGFRGGDGVKISGFSLALTGIPSTTTGDYYGGGGNGNWSQNPGALSSRPLGGGGQDVGNGPGTPGVQYSGGGAGGGGSGSPGGGATGGPGIVIIRTGGGG